MIIDIFNEILWPHFITLSHVKNKELKEQQILYTEYVDELETQRIAYYNWLNENVHKGDSFTENLGFNFLLQEDFELLLQENVGQIINPNAPAGGLGLLIE
tara:strand:+ start:93 stop:395 length:303 start_codon:yes stop_codon:yes gene_type:complete